MLYFDTSFLTPLIIPEATSESVAGFFETLPPEDLAVSHWTGVEFASLLSREVRMGGLDPATAREADSRFEAMVRESFILLLPNPDDFDRARYCLSRYETGLRAADALHLAIAWNRSSEAIYSLDKRMIAAGRTLGLQTTAGTIPGYSD